jgi:hypothetical protein
MPMPPDDVIPPLGIGPLSEWTPEPLPPRPPVYCILAPRYDGTGERVVVDPLKETTVLGADDPVPCAIGRQLRTRYGSGAAVLAEGRDYLLGSKVGPDAPARHKNEIARILRPFVEAGQIEIERLEVTVRGDTVLPDVQYVDLTTGRKTETEQP